MFKSVFCHFTHLNSTALKEFISAVVAPHTMYPIATSVLESS